MLNDWPNVRHSVTCYRACHLSLSKALSWKPSILDAWRFRKVTLRNTKPSGSIDREM